jgi:hypothetical protein
MKKFTGTYDQLVAETREVCSTPRWVRAAGYIDYALQVFEKSIEDFHADVAPSVSVGTFSRWHTAYVHVWCQLKPQALRKKTNKVSYYYRAYTHQNYMAGKWTIEQSFKHVLKTRMLSERARMAMNNLSQLAWAIESREDSIWLTPEKILELQQMLGKILRLLEKRSKRKAA